MDGLISSQGKNRFLLFLCKGLVSLILLTWLFWQVDVGSALNALSDGDWYWFTLAIGCMLAGVWFSCVKWQALLDVRDVRSSLGQLFVIYLVGIFFNNFLPTSVGGDVARGLLAGRTFGSSRVMAGSIFFERLTGLLGLVLFGLAGIAMVPPGRVTIVELGAMLAALGGIMVVLIVLCTGLMSNRSIPILPDSMTARLHPLVQESRLFWDKAKTVVVVILTTVAFLIVSILAYFSAAQVINSSATLLSLVVVVPLVTLLTMVPVSINGLGIREGGFVLLLGRFGVAAEEALIISLIIYFISLLLSICGGVCYAALKSGSIPWVRN